MKRKLVISALIAAMVTSVTACGKGTDDQTYIELNKKGVITETVIEDFSASYYSEEELQAFVETEIADYNGEKGKDVSLEELKIKDGVATLVMQYKTSEDYSKFNHLTCYNGSIVQAQTDGYDFNTEFVKAGSDKTDKRKHKQEEDLSAEPETSISKSEVLEDDDLKVLIIQTDSDIVVPGKVVYMSATGTSLEDDNRVHVDPKENPTDLKDIIYVLYK